MPPKFSFCIITDGKEPIKLLSELLSIHSQTAQASKEVIVVGRMNPIFMRVWDTYAGKYQFFDASISADLGQLGAMRNYACSKASGHYLIVSDDDILYAPDFLVGIMRLGEFDVAASHIINPDGSRFWDWATFGGPNGHHLLDYNNQDDSYVYVTGGLMTMRRRVFEAVQWSDRLGFYENEDIDFAVRLHQAGLCIVYNPLSTAIHMDETYSSFNRADVTKLSYQERKSMYAIPTP